MLVLLAKVGRRVYFEMEYLGQDSSPVSADWGNFDRQSVPSVLGHRACNRKPDNLEVC